MYKKQLITDSPPVYVVFEKLSKLITVPNHRKSHKPFFMSHFLRLNQKISISILRLKIEINKVNQN